jgi:hypothetical protein
LGASVWTGPKTERVTGGYVVRLSECQRQTSARNVREMTVVQAVLDGYRGLKGVDM